MILKRKSREKNLVRMEARCLQDNIGSERVMQKIGMSYEGTIRKGLFSKGKHHDLKLYSILDEEFFKKACVWELIKLA